MNGKTLTGIIVLVSLGIIFLGFYFFNLVSIEAGAEMVEVRNLSADGGQVSSVNRARPTKKILRLLAAGSFINRGSMKRLWNLPTLLALGTGFLLSVVCGAATGSNTEQTDKHWSEWDTVKVAAARVSIHTGTEGDEIVDYIGLKTLRECRANSRTFHQRKPQIYNAITESHKPWEAYEPYGHIEAPVPEPPLSKKIEYSISSNTQM